MPLGPAKPGVTPNAIKRGIGNYPIIETSCSHKAISKIKQMK